MRNNYGATSLIEIIAAVAIIGVLATLAIPRYMTSREKVRAAEGVQFLDRIRKEQIVFKAQKGLFANDGSVTLGDDNNSMDLSVPAFDDWDNVKFNNDAAKIGEIHRAPGADTTYWLHISEDGTITCTADANHPAYCNKIGYDPT